MPGDIVQLRLHIGKQPSRNFFPVSGSHSGRNGRQKWRQGIWRLFLKVSVEHVRREFLAQTLAVKYGNAVNPVGSVAAENQVYLFFRQAVTEIPFVHGLAQSVGH